MTKRERDRKIERKNEREREREIERETHTRNDSVADVATPEIAWRDALRCGNGDRDEDDGDGDESTLPEASGSVHS